jgi:LysM repeat protein
LLRILEVFILIGRGIEYIFFNIIIRPLITVARFLFRHFLIHIYRLYLLVSKELNKIFAPAKNKIFYPLLNKSTIHVALIFIGLAVLVNNFVIHDTQAEEFGKNTILASVVSDAQDIEITEKAALPAPSKPVNYYQIAGTLTLASASRNETASESGGENEIITTANSAALVNPGLSQTTIGNRPREAVAYYTVEGGDTISTIAEKFGISSNTILWENKLGPRDYIKPGEKLTILPMSGVSHQVQSGDTLDKIAKKYSVTTDEILQYNKLADASAIEKNQILVIPGGVMPEEPKPKPQASSSGFALFNIPPPASSSSGTKLQWPTTGHRISQYYRIGHPAIDITGNYSQPIYAADDGRAEAVGWGTGYGNRIILNHGNGIKTLYGHASKIFIKTGDYVKRGQTIGMIGCTGWCTGPHIHFEVIVNGAKPNPLSYL